MDEAAYFQAIPKAELHLHLDGSVRPRTVLELARQGGVPLPTGDLEKLKDFLQATDSTSSLVEYIKYFELPIAVLQSVPALERATYELCEDLKNDNVRYAEIRYGPWLHVQQGLSLTDVIRAVLGGWTAGRKAFGLEGGIIVTALRDMPPAQNVALAQVAGRFVNEGVVGFDLAGDEAGHPPILHQDAFRVAHSLGLNITIHAGEAAGPESVRQAISMGAVRLGHGVRAQEDAEVVAMIREEGIQLDTAPTSNAQTKAVRRLDQHPLRRFHEQGIKVTISTDSRTVSDITLTDEFVTVTRVLGCSRAQVWAMNMQALDGGFADEVTRTRLRREFVEAEAALRQADGRG
jgi:adenosine deaminase